MFRPFSQFPVFPAYQESADALGWGNNYRQVLFVELIILGAVGFLRGDFCIRSRFDVPMRRWHLAIARALTLSSFE